MPELVKHAPAAPGEAKSAPPGRLDLELEWSRVAARLGFSETTKYIDLRYRVERPIGHGSMGTVYLVFDERLERRVALKLVKSAQLNTSAAHLRLQREALALAKVDHSNVIQAYDVGSDRDEIYFTMQYVSGVTLGEWQRQERSWRRVLDVYLQAARGLAAAHAGRVVHRDFKPDNVLVGDSGLVKVVDFGIAAALREQGLPARSGDLPPIADAQEGAKTARVRRPGLVTQTGELAGTIAYMSPEQLFGRGADERSDQFSFCVALWEALAGQPPFPGDSREEITKSIREPPVGRRSIPIWLRPILSKGLSLDQEERFASMGELTRAIEGGRERRRRHAIAWGGAAALGAAGLAGWGLSSRERRPAERCEAFVAEIDAYWSPVRQAALRELEVVNAPSVSYAISTLDRLVADWRSSASSLCDGELAPAANTTQRECHAAWLETFDRHVNLLIHRGNASTLAQTPDLLAKLEPPSGNYCALQPDPLLDPDVQQLAAVTREAATFGDTEGAAASMDKLLALTQTTPEAPFSAERAEALVASAEVHVRVGEYERALEQLVAAQEQALASGHRGALFWSSLWQAKILASAGAAKSAELAAAHFAIAEPMAHALSFGAADLRRGQLELARGMVEEARGNHELAISHMDRAAEVFELAQLPTFSAKALINVSKNYIYLDDGEAAHAVLQRAVNLLDEAAVPPGHGSRLNAEYNLGLLAWQGGDPAGLAHLAHVLEYQKIPVRRLGAVGYGVSLAFDKADMESALEWAGRALDELEAQSYPDTPLAVETEMAAAIVHAASGDPGADLRMDHIQERAATIAPAAHLMVRQSRVEYLRKAGRCDDAGVQLKALDAFMAARDRDVLPADTYPQWRISQETCVAPKQGKDNEHD